MVTSSATSSPDQNGDGLSRRHLLRASAGVGAFAVFGGVGIVAARPASAAVVQPAIASCDAWGAAAPTTAISINNYRPSKILIHHTDSANTLDYSQAQAFSLSRSIQQTHFRNGWIDTGQHFTVSRGGYITEGRHRTLETLAGGSTFVMGSHCTGQNATSLGIENEGTYTSETPPPAQWDTLVDLCAFLCQTYAISAAGLYGHRDYLATDCPGNLFYAQLPNLRAAVATKLGSTLPPSRSWPTLQSGASGFRVTSMQYLLRYRGASIVADGAFGPGTSSAVRTFQSARGLAADGVVGVKTWELLVVTVAVGAANDGVRGAQTALTARGHTVAADGVFGAGTKSAVVSFQSASGLAADGIVGPDTWSKLVA